MAARDSSQEKKMTKAELLTKVRTLQARVEELEGASLEHGGRSEPLNSADGKARRQIETIDLIAKMTQALTTTLEPEVVTAEILNWTQIFIPGAICRLWGVSEDGQSQTILGSVGIDETAADTALTPRQGLSGIATIKMEPMVCVDVAKDPRFVKKAWAQEMGIVSCILLPLIHGGQVYGRLSVFTREPHEFDSDEVHLLEAFAVQAAIALANAALYTEVLQKSARLEGLNRVSASIVGNPDSEDFLKLIVTEAAKLLRLDGAALRLLEGDQLVMASEFGVWADIGLRPALAIGESLSGRIALENAPVTVSDIETNDDLLPDHKAAHLSKGVRCWIGVPVNYHDRLVGVLLSTGRYSRTFTQEDIRLLSSFADFAAIAIENRRLYRELMIKTERSDALNRLSAAIVGSLELDETLQMIVEEAPKVLGLDGAGLRLLENDRLVLVRQFGLSERLMLKPSLAIGQSPSGRVAQENRPITVSDLQSEPSVTLEHRDAIISEGARSWIGVPVRYNDRLVGVLVSIGLKQREFSKDDIQLLSSFADQAAIAIENSRLYRSVQQELTERKRAEERLRQNRDELESIVEVRTAVLRDAQAQLIRKERLATLGLLTGSVAHELRTPLGTIKVSLELIQEALSDQEPITLRAVDRALRNITRCDDIISDLLDFTRVHELRLTQLSLGPWLDGVLNEQLTSNNLNINKELSRDIVVNIDDNRFRRAIINVVQNAVQAMDTGDEKEKIRDKSISISIRADTDRVVIDIKDNGPGIKADILPKVIEPLYSTRYFGIGLGLPIVNQIMANHGGGMKISSQEGHGTHVELWLPR